VDRKINIAIDGHSSCGKSTLAKALAKALGYIYIDSGAMYRAVALHLIQNNISVSNLQAVLAVLDNIDITIAYPDGQFTIYLNAEDVTQRIIQLDVSSIVSEVAAMSAVRSKLVQIQKSLGEQKGVVMDGRDIGTVVFPQAELKLFVTANLEVRTQRRYDELIAKGMPASLEEVQHNLLHRDHIDSTRDDSPLRKAEDALLIDNSYMDRSEQLYLVQKIAKERLV
jgi:cytidylate kinase